MKLKKNSLKFFFTIQKTKKIANEFKNKVKALSLKRNSVKEQNIEKLYVWTKLDKKLMTKEPVLELKI